MIFPIFNEVALIAEQLTQFWLELDNPAKSFERIALMALTLPMLRLLSSEAQGRKDFWKPSKPSHVGIHWIALAEYF